MMDDVWRCPNQSKKKFRNDLKKMNFQQNFRIPLPEVYYIIRPCHNYYSLRKFSRNSKTLVYYLWTRFKIFNMNTTLIILSLSYWDWSGEIRTTLTQDFIRTLLHLSTNFNIIYLFYKTSLVLEWLDCDNFCIFRVNVVTEGQLEEKLLHWYIFVRDNEHW